MKQTTLLTAILIMFGASASFAEVEDANGDGVFSMDEVKVVYPDLTEDVFAQLDQDGDGALNTDELTAGIEAGILKAG